MHINNSIFIKLSIILTSFLIFFGYLIGNQYIILGISILLSIVLIFRNRIVINYLNLLWLLCIVFTLASSLYSYDTSATLKYTFVLVGVILIKITYESSDDCFLYIEKIFIRCASIHVISTILYIIFPTLMISICSKILPGNLLSDNLFFYRRGAIAGITGQTGINAFYITIYISIIFSRVICKQEKNVENILKLSLGILALMLTAKRGPMLTNIVVMAIIMFIFSNKKISDILYKVSIIALIIIVGYLTLKIIPEANVILEKFATLSSNGDITNGRSELWISSLDIFYNNIIIGNGIYSTPKLIGEMSHNIYIQLLLEGGIIGFSLFMSVLIGSIITTIIKCKKSIKNYYLNGEEKLSFAISIYIQIYFLIYGLSGNPLYGINFLATYIAAIAIGNITYIKIVRKRKDISI